MSRELTGRHVAMIFIAGFGVVIAVNLLLAVVATRTFTGTVVKNGFVASQNFNRWLEAGRAQASLGWTPRLRVEGAELVLGVDGAGEQVVTGLSVEVRLTHPMIEGDQRELLMVEGPAGLYRARHGLSAGLWDAHVTLTDGAGHSFRTTRRITVRP